MRTETVKGFRDFEGEDAVKRERVKRILADAFERYGFVPAETPIIEYESFVKGDNEGDEAISDIFKLKDKGKRKLALRYEFTFQLKRLAQNKKLPYKRYQMGPVFRDEPIKANRFRQFTQCDIDTIGSTIKDEAEILALTNEALKELGVEPLILINSRKLLNEVLEDNGVKKKDAEQVLREIDKIDKLPEEEIRKNLKKLGAENVLDSLRQGEKYFAQFLGYRDIISLKEYCKAYGVKVLFSPSIIRGLSYYNGNVFEVKAKGIRESIMGGGSYEVEKTPATGISFGLERLCMVANIPEETEDYLIVSLEQDREAIALAQKLRAQGRIVSVYYGKPSKALDYANAKKISQVVFVGAKEVKQKKFVVKDMATGKQKTLTMQKVTKKNVVVRRKK